jgi:hypothetical protein
MTISAPMTLPTMTPVWFDFAEVVDAAEAACVDEIDEEEVKVDEVVVDMGTEWVDSGASE